MKSFFIKIHEKYPLLAEIIRFLIVGGIATLVDYVITALVRVVWEPELYPDLFSIFTVDGSDYVGMWATACGFCVGLGVNYLLSVLFVFEYKGKSKSLYGAFVFAVLSLIGLGLNVLGVYVGNELLGINFWVVKIVMTVIVLVYNYISKRLLLFKKEEKELKTEEEENNG